jgi:hypothetical protein
MRQHVAVGRACVMVACWACLQALPACASPHTLDECFEAGDFIANAARARDAGMSAEAFLDRMREDYAVIQSFPRDLRWFVHDPEDETFLLTEARSVFERPMTPDLHRVRFLQDCVDQLAEP